MVTVTPGGRKIKVEVLGISKALLMIKAEQLLINAATEIGIAKGINHVKEEVEASIEGKRAEPRSVDTGKFLSSVDINIKGFKADVTSNVPYAKYLEFGTSRRAPRRHFGNTIKREEKKVNRILHTTLKAKI
jgi:HK97 gp10 family phage protein|tara:strand:+ start:1535 stop:1930 length:396 start_codon:yes stop_codon:yes gene_type:complete